MDITESAKKMIEKATGLWRPEPAELDELLRDRKAHLFKFEDDGVTPNHPYWPFCVYHSPVKLPAEHDPAAVFEELFAENGWGSSWRNGVYSFLHYHSRIHEVLGVARGEAKVRFGGDNGRALEIRAGDVAILPAGTGHQRLSASRDFLVVGAYPESGTYDLCRGTPEEHERALKTIPKVPRPHKDPVYGADGPLLKAWPSLR